MQAVALCFKKCQLDSSRKEILIIKQQHSNTKRNLVVSLFCLIKLAMHTVNSPITIIIVVICY